jgi:glycerophosphoryl diester phosphodiesterase
MVMKTAVTASSSLRRTGPDAIVVAHRGASALVPENTLPAFEAAWESGATWVEADTQPTANGVPVILHDDTLDRTTDGSGLVRALTARQVTALSVPGLPGAHVPELRELLGLLTPQRALLLEIKGEHSADEVRAVLDASRVTGQGDRVFAQSFEVTALEHLKVIAPAVPFGLLVEEIDPDPVGRCRAVGAVAYNPDYREVIAHPTVVPELRDAGITVAVWTSDDPSEWELLTRAGVDAIITNTPGELLEWQASGPLRGRRRSNHSSHSQ